MLGNNLTAAGKLKVGDQHAHHYFCLIKNEGDEPLELKFLEAGLDPNDPLYGEWLDKGLHEAIHQGKGWGLGGPWNFNWKTFFDRNPNATSEDIIDFLENKMKPVLRI